MIDRAIGLIEPLHGAEAHRNDRLFRNLFERVPLTLPQITQKNHQRVLFAHVVQEDGDHAKDADTEQTDNGAIDDQSGAGKLVAEVDLVDEFELPEHQSGNDDK